MTFTPEQFSEMGKLSRSAQDVWLLEIEIPTDPVSRYRLNSSAHDVTFGTDDLGADLVYETHPFKVGGISADSHGGIHSATVAASTVRRELMAAIEVYDGLIGREARLILTNKALLASAVPLLEVVGVISTHQARVESVEFVIGREDMYRTAIPLLRTNHDYCTHPYGGLLCGYDTTVSGALPTCSFKQFGANGCVEHGDAEEAAGLERKHPRRFGGHPGVPRRAGYRL